jgi:hypothetical protein
MPYRAAIVVFVRIGDLALGVGDTALVKRLRVAVGAIGFVSDAFSLRPFVAGGMTGAIDGAIKAAEGSILSERCDVKTTAGAKARTKMTARMNCFPDSASASVFRDFFRDPMSRNFPVKHL